MRSFPCSRCRTPVQCWPYQAPTKCCPTCLAAVKSVNGRRRTTGQTPPHDARRVRAFNQRRYAQRYRPERANAPAHGWVMEHRLVWEEANGRLLTRAEVVHHIDHDTLNNAAENLRLYASRGEHLAQEHSADGVAARMRSYPRCACGARTQHGHAECWPCWRTSQTCPTCKRPGRKMATRAMCHGCYKRHRRLRPVSTGS